MTWWEYMTILLMGTPNAALVIASSTQKQKDSGARMMLRWIQAVFAMTTWPAAALYVYYKGVIRDWPRKKKVSK